VKRPTAAGICQICNLYKPQPDPQKRCQANSWYTHYARMRQKSRPRRWHKSCEGEVGRGLVSKLAHFNANMIIEGITKCDQERAQHISKYID
jgi:hypothetical protein